MIKNAEIRIAIKIKPSDPSSSIIVSVEPATKETIVKLSGDETKLIQVDMIHDASQTSDSIYHNCQIHTLGKSLSRTILQSSHTGKLAQARPLLSRAIPITPASSSWSAWRARTKNTISVFGGHISLILRGQKGFSVPLGD